MKPASPIENLTPLGFTVVELLATVAIIFTIAAMAIPRFFAAVDQAKIARAVADVHAIGTGV